MLFRDEETGMYIPLDVLALKLAPLLQPAPADVPDAPVEAERITALEHDIDDVCKERDWFMAQLHEAKQAQLADANATAGRLACTIACMEQESAQLRRERDTYRAQADAARQAVTEAAQRAEAAEARLAAFYSPRPVYQD